MTSDYVFLDRVPRYAPVEEAEPGWIKHVVCEGARFHVLHWSSKGEHCSEERCILNKPLHDSQEGRQA